MTMTIICVIVMINTFIVNTINGMKHYSCISLLLCRLQGSDVTSYPFETIIKFPTNFLGWWKGHSPFQTPPVGAHLTPFGTSILTPLAFGPCDELRYHA